MFVRPPRCRCWGARDSQGGRKGQPMSWSWWTAGWSLPGGSWTPSRCWEDAWSKQAPQPAATVWPSVDAAGAAAVPAAGAAKQRQSKQKAKNKRQRRQEHLRPHEQRRRVERQIRHFITKGMVVKPLDEHQRAILGPERSAEVDNYIRTHHHAPPRCTRPAAVAAEGHPSTRWRLRSRSKTPPWREPPVRPVLLPPTVRPVPPWRRRVVVARGTAAAPATALPDATAPQFGRFIHKSVKQVFSRNACQT